MKKEKSKLGRERGEERRRRRKREEERRGELADCCLASCSRLIQVTAFVGPSAGLTLALLQLH